MRIYAADDEFIALETLRRSILRAAPGAELRCFDDGAELLKAAEEDAPDVVFLDIHMAGMFDGLLRQQSCVQCASGGGLRADSCIVFLHHDGLFLAPYESRTAAGQKEGEAAGRGG